MTRNTIQEHHQEHGDEHHQEHEEHRTEQLQFKKTNTMELFHY